MKNISREAIQRMVGGVNSVIGGGAGGGGDLAGYATEMWVEDKYVNKEFFSSLFKAYDANGNEVKPNDTATAIDNIKAMFGFWTDFYISALGTGGHQSVDLRLAQLADVNVAGVTNGQVLTYNSTTGKWIASTPQAGTDMATVWSNLAAADNTKQIDYSHLSGAISLSNGTITIGSSSITPITSHQSLANYFTYKGQAAESYFGNTYATLENGTYFRQFSGSSAALIHFQGSGSASGLDLYFLYPQDGSNPLYYRKTIDSNRFAGGFVRILDEYYISTTVNNGLATLNNDGLYLNGSNGWIRTYGSCGWYSQSHGGGWYMEDDTWIRSYGSKYVYINTNLASQHIYAGGGSYNANYPLYINGVGYASSGFYTAGYVTALSDVRHKNVQGDIALTVEQIAKAPAVKFTWKDEKKPGLFVGSLAQYWQKTLPEVVQQQVDGTLSLDYQVTALMASIVIARKVEDHEDRIRKLEKILKIN